MISTTSIAVYTVIGGCCTALGSWGIYALAWRMPDCKTLNSTMDQSQFPNEQRSHDQIGDNVYSLGNNRHYLVSNHPYNKSWWIWSYKKRWLSSDKRANHSDFKNISTGYSENSSTQALNQICAKQYNKKISEFVSTDREILERNIAKFCSVSGDEKTLTKFFIV